MCTFQLMAFVCSPAFYYPDPLEPSLVLASSIGLQAAALCKQLHRDQQGPELGKTVYAVDPQKIERLNFQVGLGGLFNDNGTVQRNGIAPFFKTSPFCGVVKDSLAVLGTAAANADDCVAALFSMQAFLVHIFGGEVDNDNTDRLLYKSVSICCCP